MQNKKQEVNVGAQASPSQQWAKWVATRVVLPDGTLKQLSTVNSAIGVAHTIWEWTLIVGSIAIAVTIDQWAATLACILWIGTRQHALGILVHDASHRRYLRNRWANDWLSEMLLAWPLLFTMHAYRIVHMKHHRYLDSADDPDWVAKVGREWQFPMSRTRFFGLMLFDLLGLGTWSHLRDLVAPMNVLWGIPKAQARRYLVVRTLYYGAIAVALTATQTWSLFLLYWIVPHLTSFRMVLRHRSIAEHFGVAYTHPYNLSRTTLPRWWERILFAPKNIGYHIEHHMYASVPFYRLPQLHALLQQDATYQEHAHISHGYPAVWNECTSGERTQKGSPS